MTCSGPEQRIITVPARLTYLAGPYSDPDSKIRQFRFEQLSRITALLIWQKKIIYCPIVAWHLVAQSQNLPTDAMYWDEINKTYLQYSHELIAVHLPGWKESKGMQEEIQLAEELDIPIWAYYPDLRDFPEFLKIK